MSAVDRWKSVRAPSLWIGLALVATLATLGSFGLSRSRRGVAGPRDRHPFVELHVPRLESAIPIDAEMDGKKAWESEAGSTGVFKEANGRGMVPYSEAKARWRADTLYLWLYAGDLDLEGTMTSADADLSGDDSFHIELGGDGGLVHTIDVSVLGTLSDARCTGAPGGGASRGPCDAAWQSGAVVAVDRDGTLNQTGDNDEEWIVEMAIPLASLGIREAGPGTRIPFAVRRCDIQKSGRGACGGFGDGVPSGELVFESMAVDHAEVAHAAVRP
jgi:hypothetical protein